MIVADRQAFLAAAGYNFNLLLVELLPALFMALISAPRAQAL
jgi:hypothetical protein